MARHCSDHSYELPLRRNLLLLRDVVGLLRFITGVLLDRLGVAPCPGEMMLQLPGQPWGWPGGGQEDAAALERFLDAALRAPGTTARPLPAPRYRRVPADGRADHAVCAICLAGLAAGDCQAHAVAELCGCSHAFHAACIDAWVRVGEAATCPLCRAPVVPGQTWCHARPGD